MSSQQLTFKYFQDQIDNFEPYMLSFGHYISKAYINHFFIMLGYM